jgi:hypothetical protein
MRFPEKSNFNLIVLFLSEISLKPPVADFPEVKEGNHFLNISAGFFTEI